MSCRLLLVLCVVLAITHASAKCVVTVGSNPKVLLTSLLAKSQLSGVTVYQAPASGVKGTDLTSHGCETTSPIVVVGLTGDVKNFFATLFQTWMDPGRAYKFIAMTDNAQNWVDQSQLFPEISGALKAWVIKLTPAGSAVRPVVTSTGFGMAVIKRTNNVTPTQESTEFDGIMGRQLMNTQNTATTLKEWAATNPTTVNLAVVKTASQAFLDKLATFSTTYGTKVKVITFADMLNNVDVAAQMRSLVEVYASPAHRVRATMVHVLQPQPETAELEIAAETEAESEPEEN